MMHRFPDLQRGMTLIEVLIALLVLGVGLLGVAALQAIGLKTGHSAYERSQATMLAYDLADRMRARRADALNGAYDDGSSDADRVDWNNAVATLLGDDAAGTLARDNPAVEIRMTWTDSRGNLVGTSGDTEAGDQTETQTFVYRTDL
jgi:type IV pilus assembly protein PilV